MAAGGGGGVGGAVANGDAKEEVKGVVPKAGAPPLKEKEGWEVVEGAVPNGGAAGVDTLPKLNAMIVYYTNTILPKIL
jgi:hypothetical protein